MFLIEEPFAQPNPFAESFAASTPFGAIFPLLITFLAVILIFVIAAYIYTALALSAIARKTQTEPAWLAWIPIANVYLISKIGKQEPWPMWLFFLSLLALLLTPFVGIVPAILLAIIAVMALLVFIVFYFIWNWKMFEAVGRPGWWPLLALIPYAGGIIYLVLLGIAAWGKTGATAAPQAAAPPTKK